MHKRSEGARNREQAKTDHSRMGDRGFTILHVQAERGIALKRRGNVGDNISTRR